MSSSILRRRAGLAALLVPCWLTAQAHAPGGSAAAVQNPNPRTAAVTVRAQAVIQTFQGYGEVGPVAVTQVRAVQAGVLSRLPLPGEQVRAGQVLAVLGGPQAQSLLAERRSALRAASIRLAADRRKLAVRLTTRQTVAADEATYAAARGRLRVAMRTLTLRAPAAGQVLALEAADGEQVGAGQLILTLQTGRPWLQATFYGAQALALHPGMTGTFRPSAGEPVAVRVRTVFRALQADGGEEVGLLPASPRAPAPGAAADPWRSGQWGTVTLRGASRSLVAVPTRALILDRARWWVLVRTPAGDHRRAVVPGPARGWMTFVSRGLRPGEQVVVQNAYLEFHRGIAQRYAPPD